MITLLKSLLWLLGRLPQEGPWKLAQRWAPVWMFLSPGKLRVTRANLAACYPDLEPESRERLVRTSFAHYVCSILEAGRNRYWPLDRLFALCDGSAGEAALTAALAVGKGVIVLAPHFGAWEYLGMYLQKFPDIAILYKPPANPAIGKALQQQRSRGGANMLPATAAGLRQLYSRVLAGKGVGILPDQQPASSRGGGQGEFAPFFGVPALTAVLAPRLIQKTGARVYFAVCSRLANGRYELHVFPADDDIYSPDLVTALTSLNRGVERCVAIDPAQYLWSYKRFRARPEGMAPLYS